MNEIMNKTEYAEYEATVAATLVGYDHHIVVPGPRPGCPECGLEDCDNMDSPEYEAVQEPHFASSPCDCCCCRNISLSGLPTAGNRHSAHGRINGEWQHLNVCPTCVYYLKYNRLDDQTMEEIET